MRGSVGRRKRILSLVICVALSVISVVLPVYASEEEEVDNWVSWSFDSEQISFILEETESVCPLGQPLQCVVALYFPTGQLITSGLGARGEDGSLMVKCTPCELPESYRIQFIFLDEQLRPLVSAMMYEVSTIAPTCTKKGSVLAISADGVHGQVIQSIPAEGHIFSDALVQESIDGVNCGYSERQCQKCSYVETTPVYPECSIARLCMYGDLTGIGKKAEVPITVTFEGEGQDLDCYGLLKYQGHTSLLYEKKNYTLKLFKDDARTQKNKITFYDWNKEHKYILKANYVDPSTCRNLVCADIWSEMVACRQNYPSRLDDCSNYGATDGFPVAVYLNDEFHGLYTFTLHRDDDLFDMEDEQMDGILVANTANTDAAFFKAAAVFDETSDWEVEFSGLEDTLWAENKLNDLIGFVMSSSDEEFREELDQYLDVNSALDYLIAIYSLGLTNSGAKNITLATYEDGVLFFSLCDMENAFGLSVTGETAYLPSEYLPTYTDGKWDSATNSLLWDRILQMYQPELQERYTQLRQEILTTENICGKVADYLAPISNEFYTADRELHPDMPQLPISHEKQIRDYVTQRLLLLDELFLIEDSGDSDGEER